MQVRRSITHGPEGGWSSVALHLAPAEADKDGFYLTLFPDARPQSVVFLTATQLQKLLDLAEDSAASDLAIWDLVAKVPLEPLLPSRAMGTRLRWLLLDSASSIREQVRIQLERRPPPPTPVESEEAQPDPSDGALPAAKPPTWEIS